MSDASDRGDEGKRFPLNMRTTRQLREKLEAAAKNSGRSMSQEVEYRIERSFADQEIIDRASINAVQATFSQILGDGESRKLLLTYASAIKFSEIQTGKKFHEDDLTKLLVSQVFWLIYRAWYGPISDENYSEADKKKIFDLTESIASFVVGLGDLQGRAKMEGMIGEKFDKKQD